MNTIQSEKLSQAKGLIAEAGVGAWLTFVRETIEGADPVLPLIYEGGLTWQSALIVTKSGKTIAVVGNYDADPLKASGDWDEVVPYVQSIMDPLLDVLENNVAAGESIAINYSENDVKSDGLTHGMFLLLQNILEGTRFSSSCVSAESIVRRLRGRKSEKELAKIRSAVLDTSEIFKSVQAIVRSGQSEKQVYDLIHTMMRERNLGFAWDRHGDPIVNSGPNSMIGHGIPSDAITIEPGHIFHIDLGVEKDDYCSDIQRSWYVTAGEEPPDDVTSAFSAVRGAILAAKAVLNPGVEGWTVDDAARKSIVASGYDEYLHAVGHQVGRVAHDGGTILGPKWERYGNTPFGVVEEREVYTLELGVTLEDRGYLGLEEMVVVTADGCDWIGSPQDEIWKLMA
jgi:Xaa-Pro aminopeptidase